jgi:hypothetical protein
MEALYTEKADKQAEVADVENVLRTTSDANWCKASISSPVSASIRTTGGGVC